MKTYILDEDEEVKKIAGLTLDNSNIILNLTNIWNSIKEEIYFPKRFAIDYIHELIHREIIKAIGVTPLSLQEEKVCYIMSGEIWNDDARDFYVKDYKL